MVTDNTVVVTIVHDVQVCDIYYLIKFSSNTFPSIHLQNKKLCFNEIYCQLP